MSTTRRHPRRPAYGAPVVAPILIDDSDGLTIEGPVAGVLSAMAQGIRDELYLAGIRDWEAVAIRCLIRSHFRLQSAGYLTRQLRGDTS